MSKKPQPPQSQKTPPTPPQDIKVNTKDANGYPLHKAVIDDNVEMVQALLKDPAIDVNMKDSTIHGLAPLDYAAMGNNVEMVQALLAHSKIEVNTKDTSGYTALHRAGRHWDNPNIAIALLAHKDIQVNTKSTEYGYTPLHKAVMDDNVEMVQALLGHKDIDVFVKDKNGDTAFSLLYTKKGEKFNDAIYTKLAAHIKAESKNASLG